MTKFLVSLTAEPAGEENQRNKAQPLFSRNRWLGGTRAAKTGAAFASLPHGRVHPCPPSPVNFLSCALQLEDEWPERGSERPGWGSGNCGVPSAPKMHMLSLLQLPVLPVQEVLQLPGQQLRRGQSAKWHILRPQQPAFSVACLRAKGDETFQKAGVQKRPIQMVSNVISPAMMNEMSRWAALAPLCSERGW